MTRSLAKELGPRKIRVNSINPGMVETEGVHAAGIAESDFRKQVEAQTPLGRIGQPQDIAPAAVFLASSDSAWITGETLHHRGRVPLSATRGSARVGSVTNPLTRGAGQCPGSSKARSRSSPAATAAWAWRRPSGSSPRGRTSSSPAAARPNLTRP